MRRIQVTDQAIVVAGDSLQPSAFTGLVNRHPKLEQTIALEAEASQLLKLGFSPPCGCVQQ